MSVTPTVSLFGTSHPTNKRQPHNRGALRRERASFARAAAATAALGQHWHSVSRGFVELAAVTEARLALREAA